MIDEGDRIPGPVLPMILVGAVVGLLYLIRLPKAYGEVRAAVRGEVREQPAAATAAEAAGA